MLLEAEWGCGVIAPLPEPEAEATVSLVRTKEGGRFLEVLEAAVAAAVLERFIRLETVPPPLVGPVKFAAAECNAGFKMIVFPAGATLGVSIHGFTIIQESDLISNFKGFLE